ncbi:hypothetical protein NIES2104_33010 [Leptolyngbya sp. NIES-2104]|nr:hypothetical protein NIES2104_33010 [Leptolyngbya sp. NIES-2104]
MVDLIIRKLPKKRRNLRRLFIQLDTKPRYDLNAVKFLIV